MHRTTAFGATGGGLYKEAEPATRVTAQSMNAHQEELCRAIELLGLTLDVNNNEQLYEAILAMLYPKGWGGGETPGTVVQSLVAENVVNARLVPLNKLQSGDIVEGTVHAFVAGVAGEKKLRVCVDADTGSSLLLTLDAATTGQVVFNVAFAVKAASPHLLRSWVDLNNTARWEQARGNVVVNLATTAINLQTRAWVANAADSITIDSIAWRLVRRKVA